MPDLYRTIGDKDYTIVVEIEAHDEFWVESITLDNATDEDEGIDIDPDSEEGKAVLETVDLGEFVAEFYADRADTYRDLQDDR